MCIWLTVGAWVRVWMCTTSMSTPLPGCQSVHLPTCVHGSVKAAAKNREVWGREEVLSVSAAWAGSWWEHEGGRLAGRSHALFKHHSYGARLLGQNTTRHATTHTFMHEGTTHTRKRTVLRERCVLIWSKHKWQVGVRMQCNSPAAYQTTWLEAKFGRTKGWTPFQTFLSLFSTSCNILSSQNGGCPEYFVM